MKAKHWFAGILALVLLVSGLVHPLLAEDKDLASGSRGPAVTRLKLRLFDLGYFLSLKNANDEYNKDTIRHVKAFQQQNGLPDTGVADRITRKILYSDKAVKAPLPEDRPFYDIDPDSLPPILAEEPSDKTDDGFLKPDNAPYVFKDREAGYWLYLSQNLRVEVTRYYQEKGQLEWFEAYVTYREKGKPSSVHSRNEGKRYDDPLKLAEDVGAVLAINDDYYRYRVVNKEKVGVIVREGAVQSDSTVPQRHDRIPSLEVMALFEDGRLQTFHSDTHTAREYIDMGVTDTWAFGPILVSEGEVPRYYYSKDYRSYKEPRAALGMIGENRYCALMITGRKEGSHGATFGWMAEKMLAMGATEALNLDGGGSAVMVFMDEILNKSLKSQGSRDLTGIIAFLDD